MRSLAIVLALLVACKSNEPPKPKPKAKPAEVAPVEPPPAALPAPNAKLDTKIDTSGLEHACAAATDCVLVKPALCDPCGCTTEPIASSASAAFDELGYKMICPPPDLSVKCAPCPTYVAACDAKRCVAKQR